jgi:hypothetical protein
MGEGALGLLGGYVAAAAERMALLANPRVRFVLEAEGTLDLGCGAGARGIGNAPLPRPVAVAALLRVLPLRAVGLVRFTNMTGHSVCSLLCLLI